MTEAPRIVPEDFKAREYHAAKDRPCPICDKPDWCLHGEGWALCQRIESDTRWKDAGWFHRIAGDGISAPRAIYRPPVSATMPLPRSLPPAAVKPAEGVAPLPEIGPYESALASPEAKLVRDWLTGRGIGENVATGFRLGAFNRKGEWWLTIPQFQGGELLNIKYRCCKCKEFQRIKGRPSVLFNIDALTTDCAEQGSVIIVEGEMDVLALAEIGIKNVVGLTNGAGKLEADWYDALVKFRNAGNSIVLLCDNDLGREDRKNPGQDGAREIARRLGIDQTLNCVLPNGLKDANDFILKAFESGMDRDGAREFLLAHIFDNAALFSIQNAMPLSAAIETVFQSQGQILAVDSQSVIDFPDGRLTSLFHNVMHSRGFLPFGTLTALLAPPKVGKTTLSQQICLHNALKGIPVFDYCLEMAPHEKGLLYLQQFIGHPLPFSSQELDVVRARLCSAPITLGYNQTGTKPETVLNTMSAVVGRTGAKMIVLDNLQYMFRGKDEYSRISEFTLQLKDVAAALGVVMLVIVQPNIRAMRGQNKMLDYSGVQTVTNIAADVDFFCVLHRAIVETDAATGEGTFSDFGKFKVITRLSRGGIRDVKFDNRSRTFASVDACDVPARPVKLKRQSEKDYEQPHYAK